MKRYLIKFLKKIHFKIHKLILKLEGKELVYSDFFEEKIEVKDFDYLKGNVIYDICTRIR